MHNLWKFEPTKPNSFCESCTKTQIFLIMYGTLVNFFIFAVLDGCYFFVMQLAKSWKIAQIAQVNKLFLTFDTICFCIDSNSFYRLTCLVINQNGVSKDWSISFQMKGLQILCCFSLACHTCALSVLKVLVSRRIGPTFNVCATEGHFTFLGREKANLFKRIIIELVKTK